MKKQLIAALLVLFNFFSQALTLDKNAWNDFEGTLGKSDVQMSLYLFENGDIKGNYSYRKYQQKIELIGTINGEEITLNEITSGSVTATFKGKLFTDKADHFNGDWKGKTNVLKFVLSPTSVCKSAFANRYENIYGSTAEVETFMKRVKSSVLKADKEWLGTHICYPISVNIKGKRVEIKTKTDFLKYYNLVFTEAFKLGIKNVYCVNLFTNFEGVMLGNGQIWINNGENSTEEKHTLCIIAVNN